MSLATRRKLQPYLYIAPVLIVLLLMFGYPLIKSIVMSFQDYKLSRLDKVAWNNFRTEISGCCSRTRSSMWSRPCAGSSCWAWALRLA